MSACIELIQCRQTLLSAIYMKPTLMGMENQEAHHIKAQQHEYEGRTNKDNCALPDIAE